MSLKNYFKSFGHQFNEIKAGLNRGKNNYKTNPIARIQYLVQDLMDDLDAGFKITHAEDKKAKELYDKLKRFHQKIVRYNSKYAKGMEGGVLDSEEENELRTRHVELMQDYSEVHDHFVDHMDILEDEFKVFEKILRDEQNLLKLK